MTKTNIKAVAERPSVARQMVRRSLADVPEEAVEVVQLLVSELVTNAIMHASRAPTVAIEMENGAVRVDVHDPNGSTEFVSLVRSYGRGLRIVAALASSWGATTTVDGKDVWFHVEFVT